MNESEGATTRRVMKQAAEVLNRELDSLYSDKRDNQLMIAAQNSMIDLRNNEIETLKSINRDLQANIRRDRDRNNQDCWITDFSIYFSIGGWIVAFVAIGYGVWVG